MTVRSTSLGIALGLLTAGCAQEQEALIVQNAVSTGAMGCVVDPNATPLLNGVLDMYFGSPYVLLLALQNQLSPQSADMSNGGIDNSEMQLQSADVRITSDQIPGVIDALEAQNEALVDFSVPLASDSLGGGEVQGVAVEVIPRATTEALREQFGSHPELPEGAVPRITVEVIFHARRTGNAVGGVGDVESRLYQYPIDLCVGCLLDFSGCEDGEPIPNPPYNGFEGGECGSTQNRLWGPPGCDDPNGAM